jgi:glycolate oxidase FAD binding subunit
VQSVSERVEPQTAEDASLALREAGKAGMAVSLDRPGGDLVLSTARLNRVLEHEATDLTCVVEPGIRLSELDAVLAGHGQRLALDPPGDPTVGECIAEALSGPRRHRFGAVRDLILGVTVVLADGTIASSGGKVVKNVAGYDLAKLFCGARGTLGLVVRAAFRLHPRPETISTFEAELARPRDARPLLAELSALNLPLGALDLLWPGRLIGLVEGSARVAQAQLDAAARALGARHVEDDIWERSSERQRQAAGVIAFAPSDLGEILQSESMALIRPSLGVAYVERPIDSPQSSGVLDLQERIREQFDPGRVLVG